MKVLYINAFRPFVLAGWTLKVVVTNSCPLFRPTYCDRYARSQRTYLGNKPPKNHFNYRPRPATVKILVNIFSSVVCFMINYILLCFQNRIVSTLLRITKLFFFFQDVLMEKLRLKNASLKVQKKKVSLQLRQVKTFTCLVLIDVGHCDSFYIISHLIFLFGKKHTSLMPKKCIRFFENNNIIPHCFGIFSEQKWVSLVIVSRLIAQVRFVRSSDKNNTLKSNRVIFHVFVYEKFG